MKTRYRTNWRGQIILQVWDFSLFCADYRWRDAKLKDITEGGIV